MRLKRTGDCRSIPIVYTIEEAIGYTVENDYGESFGQIESLEHRVSELTNIVAQLAAGKRVEDILHSFEPATEADIKAYEER